MVNDIKNAISIAIAGSFEEEPEIHTENIEQGLKGPCFFIKCLSPSRKKLNNTYFKDVFDFDIHYFPETDKPNSENDAVGYTLLETLVNIETVDGDKFAGSEMSFNTIDDVLHFMVTYKCMRKKVIETTDLMETVESEIREQ